MREKGRFVMISRTESPDIITFNGPIWDILASQSCFYVLGATRANHG